MVPSAKPNLVALAALLRRAPGGHLEGSGQAVIYEDIESHGAYQGRQEMLPGLLPKGTERRV